MTKTIEDLIPDYLRGLPMYVPGRPIEDVERELKIVAIKVASNENPLGPSPMAMEAVKGALGEANRYPDGGTHRLREKLAKLHGVHEDEIFVGLGSSELIDLAARVLLRSGKSGVTSEGSYAPFSIAIRANNAELRLAPLREFTFDLRAIAAKVTGDTAVIYLANPNNPTGTAFGHAEFAELLARVPESVLVVLDEAYVHYADRVDMPRSMELTRERKNLLVLRTFSKVYGLAGLRMGYGVGPRALVTAMNKLRTPFNVSGLGQVAAVAALNDAEHVRRSIEANRAERNGLHEGLTALGLRPVRSETNFIFIEIGPEANAISEELLRLGVIVRPLGWMGMAVALRVSVGTAEENGKLLNALALVCERRAGKSELASR
jgi:histidinol-phosphate aminotransferase